MTKEAIIEKTLQTLQSLPTDKAEEVADFAIFILKKHEEYILQKGIHELTEKGKVFSFLSEDEVLYSVKDIEGKY